MKHRQGFALFCFLLYLTLFSTIACYVCHSITSFILPALKATRTCQQLIALHSASDIFVRDIRRSDLFFLKKITSTKLLWNDGTKDICWRYHDNKLERTEGSYHKKKWKKKATSIIAIGLYNAIFMIDSINGKAIGVTLQLISLKNSKKTLNFYVAVRHRES